MNAWEEIKNKLDKDEMLEHVVFGSWGSFSDDAPTPEVPPNVMGCRLLPHEAKPFLLTFSFNGDYGTPECYATWIYTNKNVYWVTQYDGSTSLDSMPRNPTQDRIPYMPGG